MHKKIQVVILVGPKNLSELELLILQTCEERGAFWQNVTGSVEEDETFFEAAKRELFEECALTDGELRSINHEITFMGRFGKQVLEHCFYLHLPKRHPINLSGEHQGFKYILAKDVVATDYHFPSNYDIFQLAYQELLESE